MIKKLMFIFVLSFTLMTDIQAKTIHWLTFIDTTDKGNGIDNSGVGEADKNTRRLLYSRWIDVVNASLKDNGYNINTIDMYDGNATPENCKAIVESLDCDTSDIVVFYYVGHGTENTGKSRFPLLLFENGSHDRLIPLSWIHNTLKEKGVKLTITIGMCCNDRQGATGRTMPTFSRNYGKAFINNGATEAVKEMFLDCKGDLLVTSASPTESSRGCDSALGETDIFTLHFLSQFTNITSGKAEADWQKMLEAVKKNVYNDVKNSDEVQKKQPGATQTPIWENNLTSTSRPRGTKPTMPKVSGGNNDKSEYISMLNDAFAYITSSNVDAMERIRCADKTKPLFAGGLIVKVLTQDGNTVVERIPIEKYLGRISTNRMFQNVSVADLELDNGKVNSLYVREVLKSRK